LFIGVSKKKKRDSMPPKTPPTRPKTSFPKSKIKILLLENISDVAINAFAREEFQVEVLKGSLSEEELKKKIKGVHALGIRSKTRITEAVLAEADRLLTIGCFCIGTDQVDLSAAQRHGIPVFNSPFCNSRSVAELIICEIISLSRRLGDVNTRMHKGIWDKSAKNCHEIRGRTIGIVGYGHIGSQLSVMSEALGMKVLFYDTENIMPLGNSKPCESLDQLLQQADFVTLHVPKTEQTKDMIGEREISLMKKGSYLLNASRGTVVVLSALQKALQSGHLAGAAVDVYPVEPDENTDKWLSELQNLPNTILTPHIGGSTEEAQLAIGAELADKVVKLINTGSTATAVNFPHCDIPDDGKSTTHRVLNIHKNIPGVLKNINSILGEFNVNAQQLSTTEYVGYLIVDVDQEASKDVLNAITALPSSIRTRVLY
jgi:D-3-phosphoglycerate dehydrogenase